MPAADIAIVDGGGANIASLVFALERLGARGRLTSNPAEIAAASHVILPGVGAAAAAIGRFDEADALYQRAIDLSIRADAPTFVAASQAQWAESVLLRGDTSDTEKARTLAAAALATAQQLGLGRVEVLSRRVLERL